MVTFVELAESYAFIRAFKAKRSKAFAKRCDRWLGIPIGWRTATYWELIEEGIITPQEADELLRHQLRIMAARRR